MYSFSILQISHRHNILCKYVGGPLFYLFISKTNYYSHHASPISLSCPPPLQASVQSWCHPPPHSASTSSPTRAWENNSVTCQWGFSIRLRSVGVGLRSKRHLSVTRLLEMLSKDQPHSRKSCTGSHCAWNMSSRFNRLIYYELLFDTWQRDHRHCLSAKPCREFPENGADAALFHSRSVKLPC